MRSTLLFIFSLSLITISVNAFQPRFMTDPAISPDGDIICFVYMENLWIVPFSGGVAQRLTSTSGGVEDPCFSPDGEKILYNSFKNGRKGVYIIPSQGGLSELVCNREFDVIDFFSDGKSILASNGEFRTGTAYYKVEINSGQVELLTSFGGTFSDLSPDDEYLVFDLRGEPHREKYTGSNNGELWKYNIETKQYIRLTETTYTERYPQVSIDNDLYYCAAAGDVFQIFKAIEGDCSNSQKLTDFTSWSARDLSIARENNRMVYEYFDKIGGYDPVKGTFEIDIEIKEDLLRDFNEIESLSDIADFYAVSPNGKYIVFTNKFDLFAVPVEGGEVRQITLDNQGVTSAAIMEDNETIYYLKRNLGEINLWKTNINKLEDNELISWSIGKYLVDIYKVDKNKLMIHYDEGEVRHNVAILENNDIETIIKEKVSHTALTFHEAGSLAFFVETYLGRWSSEVFIIDLQEKSHKSLFQTKDWISGALWGKDNKSGFFSVNGQIFRLDLTALNDYSREKDFWVDAVKMKDSKKDKSEEEADQNKSETEKEISIAIDYNDANGRLIKLTNTLGWNTLVAVKNDSIFYYLNENRDIFSLRKISYTGEADELVKELGKNIDIITFNENTQSLFYRADKNMYKLDVDTKDTEQIKYKTKYNYNRYQLNHEIFDQVWCEFGRGFYSSEMHGVDWQRIKEKYEPYLEYAYTPEILSNIIEEMIGEVNASHTGYYPRADNTSKIYNSAEIGAEFKF